MTLLDMLLTCHYVAINFQSIQLGYFYIGIVRNGDVTFDYPVASNLLTF